MPEQRPDVQDIILPNLAAAYNLARWLTRDPTLAEDVVQDAVARVLTYRNSFRGDNARAWLLQIVRNTAYAVIKARAATSVDVEAEDRTTLRLSDRLAYRPSPVAPRGNSLEPGQQDAYCGYR